MGVTAVLLAIVVSAAGGLLRSEAEAWAPWLSTRLVRLAVAFLPPALRERMGEEWRAHLDDVPGSIGKVMVAAGFVLASRRIPGIRELSSRARLQKRSLDLAVAAGAIVFFAPLMLIVGLAIKLSDGGPVLFRHPRVGADGSVLFVYKFRSMRMRVDHAVTAPVDGRVTRVGRFLRRSSLDELPQLLNVLKGDMTIVGPRPGTFHQPGKTSPLKPGLTGLDHAVDPESYASDWSIARELRAMARTIAVTLRKPPRG